MTASTYLVFGDLHGRILPAFRLAQAWSREHGVALAGLLQVGDLGDSRFDRSKKRHDSLEHGMRLVAEISEEADAVFADEHCPGVMYFTAGNHEDYDLLKERGRKAKEARSFSIDAYGKLHSIRDGGVVELPNGPRIGALWGIDRRTRRQIPPGARLSRRSAAALTTSNFDVLLTHESPAGAVLAGSGSEEIGAVIRGARPAFAFFGHYHGTGRQIEGDFGATRVYHLSHLELDSRAEEGSVGVLTWGEGGGDFAYLDPAWLRTMTRGNWKHR